MLQKILNPNLLKRKQAKPSGPQRPKTVFEAAGFATTEVGPFQSQANRSSEIRDNI